MASRENEVFKRLLLQCGKLYPDARLFRQNVGTAWAGPGFNLKPGQVYRAEGGERVITSPRLVEFGLHEGSGDAIGWRSLVITPDMVGKRVAVFVSAEAKTSSGRVRKEQLNWLQNVQAAGGIAIIYREGDDLQLDLL